SGLRPQLLEDPARRRAWPIDFERLVGRQYVRARPCQPVRREHERGYAADAPDPEVVAVDVRRDVDDRSGERARRPGRTIGRGEERVMVVEVELRPIEEHGPRVRRAALAQGAD